MGTRRFLEFLQHLTGLKDLVFRICRPVDLSFYSRAVILVFLGLGLAIDPSASVVLAVSGVVQSDCDYAGAISDKELAMDFCEQLHWHGEGILFLLSASYHGGKLSAWMARGWHLIKYLRGSLQNQWGPFV